MSIEKITYFREIFEDYKSYDKTKHTHILNLLSAKEAIFSLGSRFKISLDEFNTFFEAYLHKNGGLISDLEFSDLIAKYEDELLQMAGIN